MVLIGVIPLMLLEVEVWGLHLIIRSNDLVKNVIINDRKTYYKDGWEKKFGKPTFYLDELEQLRENGVLIYTFYLDYHA
jgi:hypothetical protein